MPRPSRASLHAARGRRRQRRRKRAARRAGGASAPYHLPPALPFQLSIYHLPLAFSALTLSGLTAAVPSPRPARKRRRARPGPKG